MIIRELFQKFMRGELPIQKAIESFLAEREGRIPRMAYNYARRISKITGLPLEIVLQSEPVRKYIKKLEERI